ncbi:Phosphatidylinositol transfer protein [Thalictrum thalictroides]|uniref:Phosphatidylinositol transfer protein n=1 Tax=Thalictrum thalictroides TaxID=46969 RepID=A0A7J6W754_THATH|nr:Phosphatidylinositol transfer protein [Thalictrum thalictroides]
MECSTHNAKSSSNGVEEMNIVEDYDQEISLSDELEQYKLGVLRTSVEKKDPTSKGVDDMMLRRFLRARNLDIEKSSSLFLKYLKWRREFVPRGFISESEITKDLAAKKFFLQGLDKDGRPIGVVLVAKHFPGKGKVGVDEFKRFVVYFLDKACSRMEGGQEKFLIIADLQGWGYSNFDLRGYVGAISILQDCYPERLGKLLLVHVPYIFMAAWKMIYPFIDNNTRKKIAFVDNKKLSSTLLQYIDDSQIPETYGGKLPLVPI